MSKLMKEPVRTFSAAFDVGTRSFKYNVDADTAEVVSKIFGTCHTRLVIRPTDSLLEHLKEVIWYMDEPHANPTLVSTYLLARSVKEQGITVILSGDGGDELFGGYSRYLADRWVSFLEKVPKSIRHAVLTISRHISRAERLNKALKKADFAEGSPQRYLTWWEQFPIPERLAILTPPWYEGIDTPTQCVEATITRFPTAAWQEILSYADLTLWIAEESNMRVDKMSMAHAVEVRAPFLDYTLVELAMSIPFDRKVSWTQGKLLLKDAFRDLLPNIVLKRPKWGWFSPVYYWVNDLLWDEAKALITWLPQTGIFSQTVTELLNTYPTQNPQKIWSLIIFALWYQRYILQDV